MRSFKKLIFAAAAAATLWCLSLTASAETTADGNFTYSVGSDGNVTIDTLAATQA